MNTAYLEVTNHYGIKGRVEQRTYKWLGKSPYVRIDRDLVDDLGGVKNKRLMVGPYRLLLCEDEPWSFTCLFVRSDRLGWLRVFLYRSTRWLDLFYRRLIVTLAVWRLAEFHEARVPSWRDIKIVRKWMKK